MLGRLILAGALMLGVAAVVLGVSNAQDDGSARPKPARAPGHLEQRSSPKGYRALVYTPASLNRSRPAPLVVMLHGCGTTAEEMEGATELDQRAERNQFVVLYPDAAAQRGRCWRTATDTTRSSGDPAAIARMVRDTLARRAPVIDPARIYVSGMSSGASMTAVLGATHPDLFAALAIDAGCAYRANPCGRHRPSQPSIQLARQALATMGARARVIPVLVMQGDRDDVVPGHSRQVLDQWRITDNLVASGTTARPIAAAPNRTSEQSARRRHRSTVEQYDAAPGCPLLERWTIHGMGHAWPGGTTDPAYGFNDLRGPDGGDVIWSFFRQIRKTDQPNACARARG
jgi:poly(hydroxyalkanoate) depolymerase family esterase